MSDDIVAQLIRRDTGEVLGTVRPAVSKPRFGRAHMVVFLDTLRELARRKVPGSAWRVLVELMARADTENRAVVTQRELAEALDMDRADVAKALRVLKLADLVENPRPGLYLLDPEFCWAGRVSRWHQVVAERRQRKGPVAHAT